MGGNSEVCPEIVQEAEDVTARIADEQVGFDSFQIREPQFSKGIELDFVLGGVWAN